MESVDSKQTQSAILFRPLLLASIFMTPAYGPDTRLSKLKVTRGTGMLRGGPGGCRLESVRIEGQGNEDGKMAIPICLP